MLVAQTFQRFVEILADHEHLDPGAGDNDTKLCRCEVLALNPIYLPHEAVVYGTIGVSSTTNVIPCKIKHLAVRGLALCPSRLIQVMDSTDVLWIFGGYGNATGVGSGELMCRAVLLRLSAQDFKTTSARSGCVFYLLLRY